MAILKFLYLQNVLFQYNVTFKLMCVINLVAILKFIQKIFSMVFELYIETLVLFLDFKTRKLNIDLDI